MERESRGSGGSAGKYKGGWLGRDLLDASVQKILEKPVFFMKKAVEVNRCCAVIVVRIEIIIYGKMDLPSISAYVDLYGLLSTPVQTESDPNQLGFGIQIRAMHVRYKMHQNRKKKTTELTPRT